MANNRLDVETPKVTWRIRADDLAYLRAVFPNNKVNAVIRDLVHLYVERLKARAGNHPSQLGVLYADGSMVEALSDEAEDRATA